jgi:hypothetical protein
LRAIVSLMLDSTFPMCLSGPDLRLLYNDAYLPIAGKKHPASLGARMQDVWAELWPAMDGIVKRALVERPDFFKFSGKSFGGRPAGAGSPDLRPVPTTRPGSRA